MAGSFGTPYFDGSVVGAIETINGAPGYLYALEVQNTNATAAYLQIFDNASPTLGTTQPVQSFLVPAGGAMDKAFTVPMSFTNAIKYAATTTATGAVGPVVGLILNAVYG